MTDVERLRGELDRLVRADHLHGGTTTLEARALELSARALDVQQTGSATQRVRRALYGVAAAYMSTAMWAAVDARELDRAQQHWERAMPLAGLAGDPAGQWRTWSHASMLAHQRGRVVDSLAAADASRACAITRADPLFRSLSLARQGVARATLGEHIPTLRLLDHARNAMDRVDPHAARPSWIEFYDRAELSGLGSVMNLHLGAAREAESEAHRALALLQPTYRRNRSYYVTQLARAQLAQGDIEQATATARTIGDAPSPRTRELLHAFTRELLTRAPGAGQTRAWLTHQRDTRQE
ncbi:hypothetical protein [Embleya sp. NPDC005971]|uniref:hypothetical protein n=1 Tax=Embleya sp. NPDC005971 TaxID=3156724 RepID=UPI0033F63F40